MHDEEIVKLCWMGKIFIIAHDTRNSFVVREVERPSEDTVQVAQSSTVLAGPPPIPNRCANLWKYLKKDHYVYYLH